ncbi:MAG: hypothetical protein KBC41_01780 [Candidatus Pacebacteria bacterium]|nr:hypothetical protein [Candidatus Paceibacterota bacterium]MBP9866788.1 hypothetical protein [Candidatus Paceibacterota bacterium]
MQTLTGIPHKDIPVAGFVRGLKDLRDGNTKFRIVDSWFIVPTKSTYAKIVHEYEKVVVVFSNSGKKHPKIISITPVGNIGDLLKIMSSYHE